MPRAQSLRSDGRETVGSGEGGEGESRSSKACSLREGGSGQWAERLVSDRQGPAYLAL